MPSPTEPEALVPDADARVPGADAEAAEVLARAEKLATVLAGEAEAAEAARRLTDPTLAALEASGLLRLVVPRRWGGLGLGLEPLAQTTRLLGRGCPASAWTIAFLVMHNWLVGKFPEAFQREVFADKPWVLVPAPLAPTGSAEAADGGYRVQGRWEWATGVDHAEWVMVHAIEVGEGFATRFVMVPIADVTVEDVWFTSGMRATGSNAVVVDDVFVPGHRTLPATALLERGAGAGDDDGMAPFPVAAVLALVAAAPALGAAESAVEFFRTRLRERVLAYSLGDRQADQPAAQVRLATAQSEVRAAGALWEAALAALAAASASPAGPSVEDRAAARLAAAATVRMARAALSTVCEGSGASVYATSSPLQRWQRDVEVLKGHVVFDWDRTAELAGRVALGLDPRPTDLV